MLTCVLGFSNKDLVRRKNQVIYERVFEGKISQSFVTKFMRGTMALENIRHKQQSVDVSRTTQMSDMPKKGDSYDFKSRKALNIQISNMKAPPAPPIPTSPVSIKEPTTLARTMFSRNFGGKKLKSANNPLTNRNKKIKKGMVKRLKLNLHVMNLNHYIPKANLSKLKNVSINVTNLVTLKLLKRIN